MRKIKKILLFLKPPANWFIAVNILSAAFLGLFLYAAYISNAVSYLSDSPITCINCHVMRSAYATWQHSSHREVAGCNDCHVPHDNVISKYYFKAKDGLRHATMFTMRAEPQVIKMHEDGQKVVQKNCQQCHAQLNERVGLADKTYNDVVCDDSKLCWECHREVPHGRIHGLDAAPFSRVPLLESAVPHWLRDYTDLNNKEND